MELRYINYFKCIDYHFENRHSTNALVMFSHPCIGYLKKGHAEFIYEGKKYTAAEGDLVFISKGSRYFSVWMGSPEIHFYSINYNFLKYDESDDFPFQIVKGVDSALLDEIINSYESAPMKSLGTLYVFLNELHPRLKKEKKQRDHEALRPALIHISKHYNEKISIKELASLCNLSESSFYPKFKKYMDCSPIEYKNTITIERALGLLIESDKSIEEISYELGFSNPSYFRRLFKALTGKTPREVKNSKHSDFYHDVF